MKDYKFIRVGARVYWNDSTINDYPESAREWLRLMIFTVLDIKVKDGESVGDDTMVRVKCEDGPEGEVCAGELVPAFCHLTSKQREVFTALTIAFHNCYKEGIKFVHRDCDHELMALNGEDIDDILLEEESNEADFETISLNEAVAEDAFYAIDEQSLPTCDKNLWIKLKSRSNG